MDWAYPGRGIISKKNKKLFDAWDKADPVNLLEWKKCERIKIIQGNTNPFVVLNIEPGAKYEYKIHKMTIKKDRNN